MTGKMVLEVGVILHRLVDGFNVYDTWPAGANPFVRGNCTGRRVLPWIAVSIPC
jgi:hypothetical protein